MTKPARETLRCGVWVVTIPFMILGLSGCAYQPGGALSPSGPGWWLGLASSHRSLVGSSCPITASMLSRNARVIYDLGFLVDSRRRAAGARTPREGDLRLTSCCRCLALLAVFGLLALAELASRAPGRCG